MPVTWQETRETPKLSGRSIERKYVGWGTSSVVEARYELLQQTPAIDGYFLRKDATVEPHDDATDIWAGTVIYEIGKLQSPGNLLPPTFRFSTSGGKSKMLCSYEVVGAYGAGADPADYGGLIGVKDDGSAEGVEVEVPGFSWQETWRFKPSQLTWWYAKTVRNISATTNMQYFRGFDRGEVLFLFAEGGSQATQSQGSGDESDYREVTFHFASSPNVTDLRVGGLTGIAKGGWEYLDIKYQTVMKNEGTANAFKAQVPVRVYVHRVFRESNFNLLGIGV
jgi:hypothetical protein